MSMPREKITVLAGGKGSGGRRGDVDDWRSQLVFSNQGECKATAHNLLLIVRNDAALQGAIRYNSFTSQTEVVTPLPGPIVTECGALSDIHVGVVGAWLGQPDTYAMNPKPGQVADALALAGRERPFHPPRDYFDALAWDGQPRLATMFRGYFGGSGSSYDERVGAMLMVGVVTRAYQPGCKLDFVVIFEGEQGAGKTRGVRELCNPAWYREASESMAGKEFLLQIRGALIVEIGELSALSRADYNRVKQVVTAQVDTVRDPYGRFPGGHPRQCVFIGTTNDDNWNRDPTGARRFLPVRVSDVDIDGLIRDRDQLWAEAVHRYREGFDYWTLPANAVAEQEARFDNDAWEDPIIRWLDGKADPKHYPLDLDTWPIDKGSGIRSVSVAELLTWALDVDKPKHGRVEQMRVGAILKHLGWTKERVSLTGKRGIRWVRVKAQEADDVPF